MAYGRMIPSSEKGSFICEKCGKQRLSSSYTTGGSLPHGMHLPLIPGPMEGGRCPDSSSGHHVWKQTN